MLDLKKYLDLEEGEIFMVTRLDNLEYRVYNNTLEYRTRWSTTWDPASDSTLLRLIMNTPETLVRSHRALSSLECKQLQALLDLNLKYMAKDADGFTCAYIDEPSKDDSGEWFPEQKGACETDVFPIPGPCTVSRLCHQNDDIPLNIATTLEAGYVRIQRN